LSFPYPGDASDVFTLKTDRGIGYLDQGNGKLLAWTDLTGWEQVSETIYMLHTGQGASGLGLLLGLIALGVPVMGATGVAQWWGARRGRARFAGNIAAGKAGTIILVGSEGGTTWGFATTLHKALTAAGQRVHTGSMSAFDPARYVRAERIIILAATYGDGDAPSSAKGFLDCVRAFDRAPAIPLAVLGFGDKSFPRFCTFAKAVSDAASAKGWSEMVPFSTVDRQSPQDFARWGRELGAVMGIALEVCHQPALPASHTLTMVRRCRRRQPSSASACQRTCYGRA
jgi:sulfite reductase (NADPH) flavoprotein alpha-component